MSRRYFLIFTIFFFLYGLRIYQQQKLSKCAELKQNSYLKIYGNIKSVNYQKNGGVILQIDNYYIQDSKARNEILRIGKRVRVAGKPQIRVINRFFQQIWLINPEMIGYQSLPPSEQNKFPHPIFTFSIFTNIGEITDFFRRKALALYLKTLPEPQAGLLSGIVLGESDNLDPRLWQSLQKTGTLHLVAASGMNVTLVAKTSLNLLIVFLSRRLAYFVTLIFILMYCLLAGGSASVVRAGLMAGLGFLGLAFGREAKGGWLLLLAAAIMLLWEPMVLFDIGFQLSFCAMVGMVWVRPLLSGSCHAFSPKNGIASLLAFLGVPPKRATRSENSQRRPAPNPSAASGVGSHCGNSQNLSAASPLLNSILDTLSAQIATFPILYFTFGQIQAWSFLPNLMVIPAVPVLMMLGFLILIVGLIWLPLAQPLAWLAWPALTYFVWIIENWSKILY